MSGKPIGRFRAQAGPKVWTQPENLSDLSVLSTTEPLEWSAVDSSGGSGQGEVAADRDHQAETATVPERAVPQVDLAEQQRQRRALVTAQVTRGVKALAAPLAWLVVLAFCGGSGVAAFLWLSTIPPLPDCERLRFPSDSDRLFCAEQAARSGNPDAVLAGLTLVKDWSPDQPSYHRAKRLFKDWSWAVLATARGRALEDDLEGAIALAQKIPSNSVVHKEAQKHIARWQKDHRRGKLVEDEIQAALKAQDWKKAEARIQTLARLEGDYWQPYLNRLRQQVIVEQIARRQLQQIRRLTVSTATNPDTIGRVIGLANQIPPNSFAYPEATTEMNRLTQALIGIINNQMAQGNLQGAIASARWLPANVALPTEVEDLLWLSQAQPLATPSIPAGPIAVRLWQLWTVVPRLQQIGGNSPLHGQVQTLLPQLESQIQDLTQLQLAQGVAEADQIPTFQLAIQMAQRIAPDRPQRIYAQTLIAQWRKDIQRVEDRPFMARAQQLAKAGTVPQLKQAIRQAQRIRPGRALHGDAQKAIRGWVAQIQVIEDRPFLKQAQTLAQKKQLAAAIAAASKVRSGRALYPEAQAAIQTWTTQMQIAEDRPLLDQANALAAKGSLTAAIDLAAQIAPGRALYPEARAGISQWSAERAAFRRAQAEAGTRDGEDSDPGYQPQPSPPERLPELPPP